MRHYHADGPTPRRSGADPTHSPVHTRWTIPQYKLVLLHDAAADLMFIVRTVMELTRYCRAEATHKMWQAHHCGRAVLLTTTLERGELYVEQFAGHGLRVTIEPA